MTPKSLFRILFDDISVFLLKNQPIVSAILLCVLVSSVINPIHILEWILIYLVHPLFNLILPLTGLLISSLFSCPTKDSFLPWLEEMVNNAILYKESTYLNSYLTMPKIENVPYFFHLGFCRIGVCNVKGGKKVLFLGLFNTWIRIVS
jgi:hypothetical protein